MSEEPGSFLDSRHRDQITAVFEKKAETLWKMLDGQPDAQALVEQMHKAFFERDDLQQSQLDGISAMVKVYVQQRDEALDRLERLEFEIRRDFHGSSNPAINGMIERMREWADETQRKYFIDRIADTLEVYDFDAEDLIALLTDEHSTLGLSQQHKQWLVDFMKHVGEWNRQQKAAQAAKKAQAG